MNLTFANWSTIQWRNTVQFDEIRPKSKTGLMDPSLLLNVLWMLLLDVMLLLLRMGRMDLLLHIMHLLLLHMMRRRLLLVVHHHGLLLLWVVLVHDL